MRLTRKTAMFGAALALTSLFTLAACSDEGDDASADLSGEYEVTGFWTGAAGAAPDVTLATGEATLSNDTYDISIDASATNPAIVSSGDYTATEVGAFTQDGTTSVDGGAPFDTQCTGTWETSGVVLQLDTTCAGVRSVVELEPLS